MKYSTAQFQKRRSKDRLWQIQEAKAQFSQLIKNAEKEDQIVTQRGEPVAVVISKKRYDKLTKRPTALLDFFKNAPLPDADIEITRSKDAPRKGEL